MSMHLTPYRLFNHFANAIEIPINVRVCKTYDLKAQTLKIIRPLFIIFECVLLIMLCAVQLDYQVRFETMKISNISANDSLTIKTQRLSPEKVVPQMIFLLCRIVTQVSRIWIQLLVSR